MARNGNEMSLDEVEEIGAEAVIDAMTGATEREDELEEEIEELHDRMAKAAAIADLLVECDNDPDRIRLKPGTLCNIGLQIQELMAFDD